MRKRAISNLTSLAYNIYYDTKDIIYNILIKLTYLTSLIIEILFLPILFLAMILLMVIGG